MKIIVCPAKALLMNKDMQKEQPGNYAAIICSSYTVDETQLFWLDKKLILMFDDTVNEFRATCFSEAQAALASDFAMALDEGTTLYVCCDSGESRSAAIAAALYRRFGLDEMLIWQNHRYHPNTLVYKRMCAALDMTVTEDMIRERKQMNDEALAAAIRAARYGETEQ